MEIEELASKVVDCGYHLYRDVGPGLLESVYETVLAKRLYDLGLSVERQRPVAIEIDGIAFGDAFRYDLLVNRSLLVEVKSVDRLTPLFIKQVLTYLRFMELPLGLLINFGGDSYKEGVKRVMNNHHR